MKPLTLAILLIPCVALAAHLRGLRQIRVGTDGAGVACVQKVTDGETANIGTEFILGRWVACQFTTGASGFSVCGVELRLDTIGGANEPLDVAIYTDSGDEPDVIVGSFSATIASSTVTTDAFYTFLPTATLAGSTTYWLVCRAGDTDVSVYLPTDNSGEVGKDTMFSEDGLSWTDQDANSVFNFRINGQ